MNERATQPIVSMRNVSMAFAGVRALDGCDFELRSGEVHALMGENGAGKSTLMKVLAGVYAKDAGEIVFDGRAVEIDSPRAAQLLGIGIVHQELNLMSHLSAAQNIFIGREPRGRLRWFLDEDALNAQALAIFDRDRKSTRLNSSHRCSSYAVFCLKKKRTPSTSSTARSIVKSDVP